MRQRNPANQSVVDRLGSSQPLGNLLLPAQLGMQYIGITEAGDRPNACQTLRSERQQLRTWRALVLYAPRGPGAD